MRKQEVQSKEKPKLTILSICCRNGKKNFTKEELAKLEELVEYCINKPDDVENKKASKQND